MYVIEKQEELPLDSEQTEHEGIDADYIDLIVAYSLDDLAMKSELATVPHRLSKEKDAHWHRLAWISTDPCSTTRRTTSSPHPQQPDPLPSHGATAMSKILSLEAEERHHEQQRGADTDRERKLTSGGLRNSRSDKLP